MDAIDKKDQEWVIFIKCPDGSVIATPASKEESCIDLHRRVAAMLATQLPVSPSDVYTTFGSKLLEHRKAKLWETGMHNGSTVMANIRLRGGVCVPHTGNQSQAEAKSGKYQSPDSWLGSERIPPGIQKEPTLADDHSPLLLAR